MKKTVMWVGLMALVGGCSSEAPTSQTGANVAPVAPGTPAAQVPGSTAPAAPPAPPPTSARQAAPVAPGAAPTAGGIPQAQWAALFTPNYLDMSCRPQFFFRQCFTNVSDAECRQQMTQFVGACFADPSTAVPPVVSQGESSQVGFRVGACAGQRYELSYIQQGRRIHNPRCDNPQNWMTPPR